jgi:hypothetical protein
MARDGNRYPTSYLKLSTTPQVIQELDALVKGGLWGKTRSEVAEGLLRQQLRQQLELPFMQESGRRKDPKRATSTTPGRRRRAS